MSRLVLFALLAGCGHPTAARPCTELTAARVDTLRPLPADTAYKVVVIICGPVTR